MANFQVLPDFPPTTPGNVCYLCHSALRPVYDDHRERAVDTGLSIDFEGALVFCESCVVDMGRLVGMASAPEAQQLRDESVGALNRIEALRTQLAESDAALDALSQADSFLEQRRSVPAATTEIGVPEPAAETVKAKAKSRA